MKLHYVYYAVQKDGIKKIGATSNTERRFGRYVESKLLESFDCPWKCGDREIELQIKYFGKRDNSKHYAHWLKIRYSDAGVKGSFKGAQTTKNRYSKPKAARLTKEEINKKRIETLKLRHKEGRWDNWDNSFFKTEEYKEKLSKTSLKMWQSEEHRKKMSDIHSGCNNGNSFLTEDDVLFIRKHFFQIRNQNTKIPKGMYSTGQLSQMFNCSKAVIRNIVNGKSYKNVK